MDSEPLLVMTVDDDPCISRVVQLQLENAGYRVVRAVTAEDALDKMETIRPDVLITDVKMPGMGGIELCKRCVDLLAGHEHLTIVLTSQLDDESRAWVENHPKHCFISKPFSPRKILETIGEYLKTRATKVA